MNPIRIAFFDIDGTLIDMEKKQITPTTLEMLRRNAAAIGRPLCLATNSRLACNGSDKDLADYFAIAKIGVDIAPDFAEVARGTVYQIMMGGRKDEYTAILKDVQGAKIAAWWDRAVDIIPATGGKGVGIRKMLEYYGFAPSEAIAFGDGNNDIEMFQAVGNSVAMANASPDLKAIATDHCGHVAEEGIYHYCVEHGLI